MNFYIVSIESPSRTFAPSVTCNGSFSNSKEDPVFVFGRRHIFYFLLFSPICIFQAEENPSSAFQLIPVQRLFKRTKWFREGQSKMFPCAETLSLSLSPSLSFSDTKFNVIAVIIHNSKLN